MLVLVTESNHSPATEDFRKVLKAMANLIRTSKNSAIRDWEVKVIHQDQDSLIIEHSAKNVDVARELEVRCHWDADVKIGAMFCDSFPLLNEKLPKEQAERMATWIKQMARKPKK